MTTVVGPVACLHVANGVCHNCEKDLSWTEAVKWRAPIGWGWCLTHHDCAAAPPSKQRGSTA